MRRREWIYSAAAWWCFRAFPQSTGFDKSRVGANTAISGAGLFEAIDVIKKTGFDSIEFHPFGVPTPTPGVFPGFELEKIDAGLRGRIRSALEPFRHRSAHLPHTGPNYFSEDPAEAAAGRRRIDQSLEAALLFGATILVIHPRPAKGVSRQEHWPVMIDHFRRWADKASKNGGRLALETGYPSSVASFVQLIREINHPAVGATLDVGHQKGYKELVERVAPDEKGTAKGRKAYNDINVELVRRLGPKLFHLHIHDIDPPTWQEHKPLGIGFIDYPRLLGALREVGYGGLFIFEIGGDPRAMPGYLADSKRRFESFLAGTN